MAVLRSLLRAGYRLYERLIQRRLDPHVRDVAAVLQGVQTFGHLSSRALYSMAGAVHRRTYQRGEVLYHEGDPGLGLYVVEAGRVRLTTEKSGRPHELQELEVHEMIGALSLLGDFRRLETAETVTETRVLGFFRPDLKTVVRRDPKAGAEIRKALGRHIAARYVGLVRRLEEHNDHEMALKAHVEAAQAIGTDAPPEL